MKEIELLENHKSKLKREIDTLKEEKSYVEKKFVALENENNDFLNKARELEYWAEELKAKLDAALEENIILHNENDTYKQEMEETLQRMQEELEDAKSETTSKEKIISRLTMHRDFLLKTLYSTQDDIDNNVLKPSVRHSSSYRNKSSHQLPLVSSSSSILNKMPERFMQSYSKSFFSNKLEAKKVLAEESRSFVKTGENFNMTDPKNDSEDYNTRPSFNVAKHDDDIKGHYLEQEKLISKQVEKLLTKDIKSSFVVNDSDKNEESEEREFIRQKIEAELKSILDTRRNFVIDTLTQENFSFDIMTRVNSNSKAKVNSKVIAGIDEMLVKVQQRKEKVMTQKKMVTLKLEKMGMKLRE